MEAEGEEDVESAEALVPSVEIALGHRESVAEVEESVHVGVRESLKELGLLVGLSDEILVTVPDVPGPLLERNEFVSTCGVLHIVVN